MPKTDRKRPRPASLTAATSFASCSALRNAVTGTASFVSLSIMIAIPTPQLGWQPQVSWPNSFSAPCVTSAQSVKLPMNEIGNQSRIGAAMRVRCVADPVELQVRVTQPGFGGFLRELRILGELDAVGRRLDAVVADLARVAHGVEEVRRDRRLAAGELHRHLAPRFDADG